MTLLFKPQYVPLILSGRKTQTRRLWQAARVKAGNEYWASTSRFRKEGRFARLRVLRVWKEALSAVSEADARAEGFQDVDGFFRAFGENSGVSPDALVGAVVWAVEFELVKEESLRAIGRRLPTAGPPPIGEEG